MSLARNLAAAAVVPGGLTPTGVVLPFAGTAAPSGWLLCAGQAVSRTTYAALFAVLGTTYGAGDGSTTFGLPDLRRLVAFIDCLFFCEKDHCEECYEIE